MKSISSRAVRLIRHGESSATAGQSTDDPFEIGLTELGLQQAQDVAASFHESPDLIIHSPMRRAAMTALPTMQRFPDVPVMQLDIEEFTYLDPVRCRGTTATERKAWVDAYWNAGDIDSHDDGWDVLDCLAGRESRCESFIDFVIRVQRFVSQMTEDMEGSRRIAVFGHGQHLLRTHIELMRTTYHDGLTTVDARYMGKHGYAHIESDMRAFPSLLRCMHLGNGQSEYWLLDGQRWRKASCKDGWWPN